MMNRLRIRMVERYLGGRMSPSDAQSFHQRLEIDPKLRQLLQQEKTIENALRHDRDSIPVMGTQRLERMLKGENPIGSSSNTSSRHRHLEPGGTGSSPADSRIARGVMRWMTRREAMIAISAIGALLVALVLFSIADADVPDAGGMPAPSSVPLPGAVPDANPMDTPGVHTSQTAPLGQPERSDATLTGGNDSVPVLQGSVPLPRALMPDTDTVAPSTAMKRRGIASPIDSVEQMRRYLQQESQREGEVLERSDSVQMKIQLRN